MQNVSKGTQMMKMIFFQQLLTKGKFDLTFKVFMVYNAMFFLQSIIDYICGDWCVKSSNGWK
jgi:hypothetical protein